MGGVQFRMWRETHQALTALADVEGVSLVVMVDRLVSNEIARRVSKPSATTIEQAEALTGLERN